MSDRIRIGVIGVGSLGEWHTKNYCGIEQAEVVGVYDVSSRRAAEIAARYGTTAFPTLDELIPKIQAASVVVPADRHAEIALPLLEKGIHLLVEKPIASDIASAEKMVKLAKKKNLVLQAGHVERFNPAVKAARALVKNPAFIEAVRTGPFPPPREGMKPRGTEVSVVLDLMIHDIDIVLHLAGSEVRELHATGVRELSDSADMVSARLVFENGCVANLTASRINPERARRIRIYQPGAVLSFDYQSQTGEVLRPDSTGTGMVSEAVAVEAGEPLKLELSSFVKSVAEHKTPEVSGEEALEALKVAMAIHGQACGDDR